MSAFPLLTITEGKLIIPKHHFLSSPVEIEI